MRFVSKAGLAWSAALAVLVAGAVWSRGQAVDGKKADGKPETSATKDAPKPATAKVEKGPIKVEVDLKGIVEAGDAAEVSIKPEAWSMPLTIEKVIEHGTAVKKGDVLVEFDTEKIDEQIKDLRVSRALAEVALKQAEEELPVLEKFMPLDLAAAERAKNQADEDLARFLEIDRPLDELAAEFQTKSAHHWLEYAQDELAQLEKMYRDKDLTEETEQLILKRHRHQVEQAQFSVRQAENSRDQTLKVRLPRQEETSRETASKTGLALEKARHLLPLEINQKRLNLEKLRYDNEKNDEKLAKLEKDRKAMTVRAPADGIAFYGRADHGQWTAAQQVAQKLTQGGVIAPQEVFMTIVSARPAFVRATIEEKDLHAIKPKLEGKAVPVGYPDLKLPARVASVAAVPQTPGNFLARVDVDLGRDAEMVMPGMACTVKFVTYKKDDALTVPASAVFSDDDGDTHYVYLAKKDAKPEKTTVKAGKTAGGKTEVLDGLKEGDEILTSKP
jgi:multidrug efflux pump subunit AcrA (membrane-fusion protein)